MKTSKARWTGFEDQLGQGLSFSVQVCVQYHQAGPSLIGPIWLILHKTFSHHKGFGLSLPSGLRCFFFHSGSQSPWDPAEESAFLCQDGAADDASLLFIVFPVSY